ncbi:titin homolog [Papilio machaon]|uniref:titin homolog n=1 Tax=Papilio machaon TaxID=76193 RepID=UPI001E664B2D|nr:titin homolog [Papilio machaon]
MESSDDFAWTDTSEDSTIMKENGDDGDSESGYSYKQKLQKKLFNNQEISNQYDNEQKKSKKRKHSELESNNVEEPKTKQIKTEPESDLDIKPKKKKSKTSISESVLPDEEFLNLKVKEEQMSTEWKSPKPKKKKKRRTNSESADYSSFSESQSQGIDNSQCENDIDVHLELSQENDYSNLKEEPEDNEKVKNKKKSKKKKEKETIDDTIIEDKFSAEETLVEERISNVHESESIIEEKVQKERNTDESIDESEGTYNTKQSLSENQDNTNHIESSQDKKRKNKKERNSLFDKLAPTDEIISANGSITPLKPLRKITDRIRFEEDTLDSSHDEEEVKSVKHSAALKKYLKRNAHLNQITVNQNSSAVITDEDEVWVLKCPSEVDINSLKDTSLVLDTKCKLKANSQTYVGFIENYTAQIALLTLDQNKPIIKNVPLSGMIRFSKRIPKAHYVEDNNIVNSQTSFIPLPDTKSRHPLFGVNYRSAIKIPKHISNRLKGLETQLISEDNEKRKKKKKKHKKEVNTSDNELHMKPEPEPEPIVHKKRKRKHSHNDDISPKVSKRLKHDPDSAEAWDSEKAIEQQLFNF